MKTVMVFGTFDIVHPGHLYVFEEAKKLGDKLIVGLATDATVKKIKNQEPFYNQQQRKNFLEHITEIDEVHIGDEDNPYLIVKKHQPDIIVLGYDQNVFVEKLEQALKDMGLLETKVIRLEKYLDQDIKSSALRRYIENNS